MNSYQLNFKLQNSAYRLILKKNTMINSYINSISFHVPDEIITNDDLSKMMDTSDEWIRTRTGIHQRHTVGKNCLGPADLAVEASKKALHSSELNKEDIDFVVFATSTPDFFVPGSGSIFQEKMGLNNIGVLDIRQGCSGFTYAITVANQFIKAGTHKKYISYRSRSSNNSTRF